MSCNASRRNQTWPLTNKWSWRAPERTSRWEALQSGLSRTFGRGTFEEDKSALGAVLAPVFVLLCFVLGIGAIWLFFFLRRLSG